MNPRTLKISLVTAAVFLVAVLVAVAVGQSNRPDEAYSPELLEADQAMDPKFGGSGETTSSEEATDTAEMTLETTRDRADAGAAGSSAGGGATSGSSAGGTSDDGDGAADAPTPPPAPVNRLTLEERKACYYELIQAEDRAVAEAEERHPLGVDEAEVDAHVALRFELLRQYKAEVVEKYDITAAELDSIAIEGITNGWPMPPLEN